jgi:hypothetical protein
MAKMDLSGVKVEIHAACIVAASQIIASPKPGLVGDKSAVPQRVATLAAQILEAYAPNLYPTMKPK